MLIAKNRLPRRIMGNGQEVEKLVVSGTTWFDATSTIPVEGSPELFKYTTTRMNNQRHFRYQFCKVASGKKTNILYKDSEGYCYVIDTTKGENGIVVRFNGTLEYKDPNGLSGSGALVIFDASDASIQITDEDFYWLKSINSSLSSSDNAVWDAKLILCKYLPIVRSDLDPITTIVPKTRMMNNSLEGASAGYGYVYVSEPKAGPQYNVLVKNQGTKDYNLKAKIGRLINTPTLTVTDNKYYNDYSTITLECDDSWLDTREQVFIDGTQS